MKRSYLFLVCGILMVSFVAEGRRKANVIRGGQGFLFPDHNAITNPGQLSRNKGTSVEVLYGRQDITIMSIDNTIQTVRPSLAYANGRLGLGFWAQRLGTSLESDSSLDMVGGGLGFSLGKRRNINLGVTYERIVEEGIGDDGKVGAMLNFNPSKGEGLSAGVGVETTINNTVGDDVLSGTVGIGYSGRNRNNNVEANLTFDDLDNTDEYTLAGYFSLGDKSYYFGAGYEYVKTATDNDSTLLGRVGLLLGRGGNVDLSVFVSYPLEDTQDPFYGATLRANF